MAIKIRDWFVLSTGVVLVLLGGFQIVYDLESLQVKDLILGSIGLIVYALLYVQYRYKGDKSLFDEYYSVKFYKTLEYALVAILIMIGIIVMIFQKDDMLSVHYIYGAIRLGMGAWLLYFSYLVMRESSYE